MINTGICRAANRYGKEKNNRKIMKLSNLLDVGHGGNHSSITVHSVACLLISDELNN